MTSDLLVFVYVAGLLGLLVVVGLYEGRRRKRFEPAPSEDNIFRCARCGFVYTDDADVERSRCPQCGTQNETFQF